jgi:hypothetical protein
MIFEKLNDKYIEDAVKLAQTQYDMEREQIEVLHEKNYKDILTASISSIFKRNFGAIAVERGKLLGYLSFWGG